MRRLHVIGAIVIALWLLTLGWLVWRERHSESAQALATPLQMDSSGWHARCASCAA
jgi:hypothetical protein